MSGRSKKKAAAKLSSPPVSPAGEMPEAADSRPLKSESPVAGLNDRWRVPGVCLFLAAIVWLVFGQTLGHEFVSFDDGIYVYENPVVQKGLTWEGFRWALTYGSIGHWHPLTWIFHMLDCQLYGLSPRGHHLTNVLLHTATVILLFLVLRRMTGFLWRSAFVAAVFAIHPLRVESVAWIAERKDVLSAFFFMLTLWAYTRYAQGRSSVERRASSAGTSSLALDPLARRSEAKMARLSTLGYYLLVLFFFALGLLSKNMLVTTPFVLLLLDYWPLNRLSSFSPRVLLRLVAEKIPLFILTIGSCVATALVPEKVTADNSLFFGLRMENAVVSYVTYLWQMIYPSGLACVYPNPANYLPLWQVAGAVGLLLAISVVAWTFRRTRPWLVVGWLWYVGMMIPVIGIVQISYYAHADRYTYLPQIGLYWLLAWAAAELSAGWRHRRVLLGVCSTIILVALIFCARTQASYWRNSETLWTHTLACTAGNYVAYNNLGSVLLQKGKGNEAIAQYQKALEINPDYADAHYNLGNILCQKGRVDEAIAHYQKALQINPDDAEVHNNLGLALLQKGNVDEAIAQYQKALEIKPDYAGACYNLGEALFQEGKLDEAVAQYQKALQIKPDYAEAHDSLANALLQKGQVDEAIAHYQKALKIKPGYAGACYNLGNALCQKGRVDEAIAYYQKALAIKPDYAEAHDNLGNALCQEGRVDEAIAHYQQALQIKPGYANARINLDNAQIKKGRRDAITRCQKALQTKPDSVEDLNNLAWLLATCPDARLRDGVQAVNHAERACELTHYGVTPLVGTLAAAYAEAGRYDDAMAAAQKACALATAAGERELLETNQKLLALYRAHQPYHEPAGKIVPAVPQP